MSGRDFVVRLFVMSLEPEVGLLRDVHRLGRIPVTHFGSCPRGMLFSEVTGLAVSTM